MRRRTRDRWQYLVLMALLLGTVVALAVADVLTAGHTWLWLRVTP